MKEERKTTSTVDFPIWFSSGCYGGLACCMFTIAANALYTTLRRRGTTRQLATAIVVCVISALLLLPALVWYNLRFSIEQAALSTAEIEVALAYVVLCGWMLPLSITSSYYLFSVPRTSTSSMKIPKQKRSTRVNAATALRPPRYQPGVPAPFVFSEDKPWGWLEHRGGHFQGQRLELKRTVATIGRDEENDIWLDDDMASRHHAELAWDKGLVYVTDCDSLNGVLLNGQRLRGTALVEPGELLEIGSHRFVFVRAEQQEAPSEHSDPLANHTWRSSLDTLTAGSDLLPAMTPLKGETAQDQPSSSVSQSSVDEKLENELGGVWQDTLELPQISPPQPPEHSGALTIQDGELAGRSFLLDRPVILIGRGVGSDVIIPDLSISRRHVQFSRQMSGDYVQDLASRNGTKVNDELLVGPRLLQPGDIVRLGNICLEYTSVQTTRTAPPPFLITPRVFARSLSGPVPLRLPSKPVSR